MLPNITTSWLSPCSLRRFWWSFSRVDRLNAVPKSYRVSRIKTETLAHSEVSIYNKSFSNSWHLKVNPPQLYRPMKLVLHYWALILCASLSAAVAHHFIVELETRTTHNTHSFRRASFALFLYNMSNARSGSWLRLFVPKEKQSQTWNYEEIQRWWHLPWLRREAQRTFHIQMF